MTDSIHNAIALVLIIFVPLIGFMIWAEYREWAIRRRNAKRFGLIYETGGRPAIIKQANDSWSAMMDAMARNDDDATDRHYREFVRASRYTHVAG